MLFWSDTIVNNGVMINEGGKV